MSDLKIALRNAIDWCCTNKLFMTDEQLADLNILSVAVKAVGDITSISAQYHDAITQAIVDYFTGDRRRQDANADFRKATTNAFGDGFETGWIDGGGEMPIDDTDALDWLNARQEQEYGFVNILFAQMKDLKDEKDFDYFSFATERADGYTATLNSVYAEGRLRASKNKMLTFTGTDGSADHICQSIGGTCVRLMGQRHRASWWVAHGLIPGSGNNNYDCGGFNCQHILEADDGEQFTGGGA